MRCSPWLVLLTVSLASPAFAAPPDPVGINVPGEGELIALGEQAIPIKPTPYTNATKYDCAVSQGKVSWKSPPSQYPICSLSIADQAKLRPGPAKITVRVMLGKRWLPAKTIDVELTGTEPPSEDAVHDAPLRGGGATYKMLPPNGAGSVKVQIAVGADKWKVLRPGDVQDSYISLHHGSDPDAGALLSALRCDNPDADECVKYGLEDRLKVYASAPEATTTARGPHRALGTTSWTKDMRDKRANATRTFTWYAGGVSEFDPASSLVITCGTQATTSEAHFKQVLKFCETMKLVR